MKLERRRDDDALRCGCQSGYGMDAGKRGVPPSGRAADTPAVSYPRKRGDYSAWRLSWIGALPVGKRLQVYHMY